MEQFYFEARTIVPASRKRMFSQAKYDSPLKNKYAQLGSFFFEDFIKRNLMVQSEFHLNISAESYKFIYFKIFFLYVLSGSVQVGWSMIFVFCDWCTASQARNM